jgi:hypothetical protein
MSMNNPLADNAPTDHEDQALVMRTRSGDRQALEHLIERHQGWIYNIAVRMLYHPQDAEDATQEILVKVPTRPLAAKNARLMTEGQVLWFHSRPTTESAWQA